MTRIYNRICYLVTCIFGYEYLVLNKIINAPSIFHYMKRTVPAFSLEDFSPEPGRTISYTIGWVGFGFIATLLLYSIRKRFQNFQKWGSLSGWLNFHVFCGLIGPILIIFHSNFKVGGLVAISFWSMVVSATSGIVGRYFYFQVLQTRGQLADQARFYDKGFTQLQVAQRIPAQTIEGLKIRAVATACGFRKSRGKQTGFFNILLSSAVGDIASFLYPPPLPPGMHKSLHLRLREYGQIQRKMYFLDTYKQFMGYWHAFHLPFAIFMYVVAVIHIITALLFKVHV